ncbi:PF06797 family protein [Leptospira borgpetersenii serovar Pomona str. 200901868]|uniref:PF06797 family protein n=1 Tax=Leptospira borgpetersenii serovar Pomona str. 200901868 TaxID=1192866 RepID=M6VTV2_LEPBO|nr:PF06797 family protein [Leptospira borgpetersenii serovar Pomona str. 200901868]
MSARFSLKSASVIADYLFKFRIFSLPVICWICSILIGLGTVNGRLSLFTLGLSFLISILLLKNIKWNISSIFSLLLIVSFLLTYFFFYKTPNMPQHLDGKLNPVLYVFKAFPVLFSFFIIFALPSSKQKRLFFVGIALGMLLFAIINSAATVVYLESPYYGKAFHFFYKIKYNSPGITILASMLPIVLFCFNGYLLKINKKLKSENVFFVVVFLISLSISFLFSARTFFFLIIANIIVLVLIRLWKIYSVPDKSVYYKFFIGLLILFISGSFIYFFLKETYIGQRIMNGIYSEKLNHHIDYWNTVKKGFFVYPKITIGSEYTFWYHNVFFDSHKTSGPITTLILYIYSFFIFIIAFKNSLQKSNKSFRYFHFYICFIPYLITTVPWESSEHQMMALFTGLGALITTVDDKASKI